MDKDFGNEKKILIIVENLPVPFDTRVWQEATTLAENGYTVSVICPQSKGFNKEYEYLQGVNIFRHKMPKEGDGILGYIKEYYCALKEEYQLAKKVYNKIGFQVIQGCNPPDNIFLIADRFKKYGVKYIFDHHDICPELYEAKFGKKSGLIYKVLLWLERQTYKHCYRAFVTNESYKQIAISRGKMDPNKVSILRSGPNLKRLRIIPPEDTLKHGHKYMIGYVGVIGEQEGIEYILKSASYIKNTLENNDIYWAIVGGGPHLNKLKELSNSMGLDDIVIFTGRVSDDLLLKYINTADICVNSDEFNSMNDKSTMNKILEYMALGKPIVQFDLKEGRYSAQKASLYAKPNDSIDMANKIIYLLNNPVQREQMSIYGRNRIVNELSWDHTSKILLEVYNQVFEDISAH
jgi:glycosyltransferase involved in cell wall biosynthesis